MGAGCAMEGATRGLNVALLDGDDFAAGTSGRSTKLIHGGIRYLEQAVFSADVTKLELVIEALAERAHLLNAAPFMAHPVPIMIPLYKWWELPYMYAGAKAYDIFAWGRRAVPASTLILKVSGACSGARVRWRESAAWPAAAQLALCVPSATRWARGASQRAAHCPGCRSECQRALSPHRPSATPGRARRVPCPTCAGRGHVPLPDAQP